MKYYEKENNLNFKDELIAQLEPAKIDAQRMQKIQEGIVLASVNKGLKSNSSEPWNDYDVILATQNIFDMQASSNTQFIMLGELARSIKERRDTVESAGLEWGLKEKQVTPEIKSLFKTWGFVEEPYGYSYSFTPPTKWDVKIPVKVKVIKKKWKFFDCLDVGFFGADGFNIPNPFNLYWESRGLVK